MSMRAFRTVQALQSYLSSIRGSQTIGFVPTMGALHEGHLALVRQSLRRDDCTVVSIFVNPTQFNDPEDYRLYPRSVDSDMALLEHEGVDVVFIPSESEIYPHGRDAWEPIDLGGLDQILEGAHRPGHFQGVAQVVKRLLDIVQPHRLYLGQKDYQQIAVIRKMLQHFQLPVEIVEVPTVREPSGLAMSSRNQRLSALDRLRASRLFEALVYLEQMYHDDVPLPTALQRAQDMLDLPDFRLEYLVVCDAQTFRVLQTWKDAPQKIALLACWVKDVRLIDNLPLDTPSS